MFHVGQKVVLVNAYYMVMSELVLIDHAFGQGMLPNRLNNVTYPRP